MATPALLVNGRPCLKTAVFLIAASLASLAIAGDGVKPPIAKPAAKAKATEKEGRLAPVPANAARPVVAAPVQGLASTDADGNTPSAKLIAAKRAQANSALAELGLYLLRSQAATDGHAKHNAVVAPYSVGMALGMLYQAAAHQTADEISSLLEPRTANHQLANTGFFGLESVMKSGGATDWAAGNRLWVAADAVKQASPVFLSKLRADFGADVQPAEFSKDPEGARQAINRWAAELTRQTVKELVPPGSISPGTKFTLTNAAYFKGKWAIPFEPVSTTSRVFWADDGTHLEVPTMNGVIQVREGQLDNNYIMEIPYSGAEFSLLLCLPPAGHKIQALEQDLSGALLAAWSTHLKPQSVNLYLPRFQILPKPAALGTALRAAGMTTAFTPAAQFPALSKQSLQLAEIFHGAGIQVDESGSVASAASGAVVNAKSLNLAAPTREFNRPFLFVVLHKPTGTPLFVGRVAKPS